MSEGHESTVPAFIPVTWDKDDAPQGYKRVEECTSAEIRAHVIRLMEQQEAIQADIDRLTAYALARFGGTGIDTDD